MTVKVVNVPEQKQNDVADFVIAIRKGKIFLNSKYKSMVFGSDDLITLHLPDYQGNQIEPLSFLRRCLFPLLS